MEATFLEVLKKIHSDCHELCQRILSKGLQIAGNIGVFCKDDEEYKRFSKLCGELIKPSDNPNQKYFELKEPISISDATYTHLYIRKPDTTEYGKYRGDIDFIMSPTEFDLLKQKVNAGGIPGAEIYNRPGWDMVKLTSSDIGSVSYVTTKKMAEKIRVRFD